MSEQKPNTTKGPVRLVPKKLGTTATSSFAKVKDFLNQEVKPPFTLDLKRIAIKSHEVLYNASTVFPITLFPDTVILDRTKVTIIKRTFFWTESIISIRIEDILNTSASVGPFFGSLTVSSRVMNSTDHYEIDYFWRKDAIILKHLIQGYMIAQHNKLETSHLSKDELIETLGELGHDSQ